MNNWTPDRPTKPGKYELSLKPELRYPLPVRLVAVIDQDGAINAYGGFGGCWYWDGDEDWLDGALWRPYVEPPDPFADPAPSLRSRIELLPWHACPSGGPHIDRCAVLALLEKESQ